MTVGIDAVSGTPSNTTGGGGGDISFSHSGGTPQGVAVFVIAPTTQASNILGITYGTAGLSPVGSRFLYSSGSESDGTLWAYFLGEDVPSGTQTVAIDLDSGSGQNKHAWCVTLTGAGDLEVHGSLVTADPAESANPSLVVPATKESMFLATLVSGQDTAGSVSVGSGTTELRETDMGAAVYSAARSTTVQSSDFTFNWTAASEEWHIIAFAVAEASAPTTSGAKRRANRDGLIRSDAVHRASRW